MTDQEFKKEIKEYIRNGRVTAVSKIIRHTDLDYTEAIRLSNELKFAFNNDVDPWVDRNAQKLGLIIVKKPVAKKVARKPVKKAVAKNPVKKTVAKKTTAKSTTSKVKNAPKARRKRRTTKKI